MSFLEMTEKASGGERTKRGRGKKDGKESTIQTERERERGEEMERSKVERGVGFGEASNSVRHSAQQAAVLSKALHHRNVIIFPFQSPLKGLEQCNWRKKLFVTLDVSRVSQ